MLENLEKRKSSNQRFNHIEHLDEFILLLVRDRSFLTDERENVYSVNEETKLKMAVLVN